ncbi:hypothetical protein BGW36DRAFT_355618 [Talaromyces proteolyticus]|uniref:Aminoglycoside phosphotransferase domain-containing protein n=1 Tax=Talaromyces proteolyticus TaxID=1131652 RepID=A0AAD4KZ76_9EURO|nr:uncharacterized protein BGW36DRAFT_355618 [Talaromyces proteolyticus]KAH8704246.1 hypothetical protein BGW36DRAFT_355618 [Talaromyces proteolyticus]
MGNDSNDLRLYPLVLCYTDLCRRNMRLGEDGKLIYLVDWGHARFYPHFYEVASPSYMNPYDATYQGPLIEAVELLIQLTDDEKNMMKLILYALYTLCRARRFSFLHVKSLWKIISVDSGLQLLN